MNSSDIIIGTVAAVLATPMSGLMTLIVETDDGAVTLHADNGPCVRAFNRILGNVIQPGHSFNPARIVGERVGIIMDDMGLTVAAIMPEADALDLIDDLDARADLDAEAAEAQEGIG